MAIIPRSFLYTPFPRLHPSFPFLTLVFITDFLNPLKHPVDILLFQNLFVTSINQWLMTLFSNKPKNRGYHTFFVAVYYQPRCFSCSCTTWLPFDILGGPFQNLLVSYWTDFGPSQLLFCPKSSPVLHVLGFANFVSLFDRMPFHLSISKLHVNTLRGCFILTPDPSA